MTTVYACADKVPDFMKRFFKEGVKYLTTNANSKWFSVVAENGILSRQSWSPKHGVIHWTRIEYPFRDSEAVEALIKAVGDGLADGFTASRWIAVNAAYNQLEATDE